MNKVCFAGTNMRNSLIEIKDFFQLKDAVLCHTVSNDIKVRTMEGGERTVTLWSPNQFLEVWELEFSRRFNFTILGRLFRSINAVINKFKKALS